MEPPSGEDKFLVYWLGVFEANGKLSNSVTGCWKLRCAHFSGRIRPHAWTEEKCAHAPHTKLSDTIERATILLYESEFTVGRRLEKVTKLQVEEALRAHPAHHARLPRTWVPKTVTLQDKQKGRGKSRKR